MRIAILSDIHGNLPALEAVLADLRDQAPDLIVNLGDHLSGPLQAAATADLLMAQHDWAQIRGNHDRNLIERAPEAMGLSDAAANEQITDAHRAWLQSLQPAAAVEGVLLCHGTPASDAEYLLEDVSPSGVHLAPAELVRSRLAGQAGVILCGHSHVPRFVQAGDSTLVVNPGSVGLQAYDDFEHRFPHYIETGSPHARYALLDFAGRDTRVSFRLVDYDWDAASRLARDGHRPDWAHALATGYALR